MTIEREEERFFGLFNTKPKEVMPMASEIMNSSINFLTGEVKLRNYVMAIDDDTLIYYPTPHDQLVEVLRKEQINNRPVESTRRFGKKIIYRWRPTR